MDFRFEVFPAWMEWPQATQDIARVEPTAEKLRLTAKVANFEMLPTLECLEDIWCFDINDGRLAVVARCESIRRLFIDGLKASNFSEFAKLPSLEVLSLESCSGVSSLADLQLRSDLKGLGIINFKNLHSIDEISELRLLKSLAIAGSMWARMTIRSLEPISELQQLEELDLSNTKVSDESLRPLGRLQQLKLLNIANFYPMEEFAWLSGRLKKTKCTWFVPYIEFEHSKCKKCGKHAMVILTGKGKSQLCKTCDPARLRRHIEAFYAAAQP